MTGVAEKGIGREKGMRRKEERGRKRRKVYRAEGKGRGGWNEQGNREGAEEARRTRGGQKE